MDKIKEWQNKWNKYIQNEKLKDLLIYPKEITNILLNVEIKDVHMSANGQKFIKIYIAEHLFEFEAGKGIYSKLVYRGLVNEGQRIIDKLFKNFPFEEMVEEILKEKYEMKYKDVLIEDIKVGPDGKARILLSNGEVFRNW